MKNSPTERPEQPPKTEIAGELMRIKKEAEGFSNGINLDTSSERGEKPTEALARKARRALDKQLSTREKKIGVILDELEAAPTSDALKELIQSGAKLEEMTQLLLEQAEIAEKKSQGTVASEPYKDRVLAVGNFSHDLLGIFRAGESLIPAQVAGQLKKLILFSGETKPPVVEAPQQEPKVETKKGGSRESNASSVQKEHNPKLEGTHPRGWNDIVLDVDRVDFIERREGKDIINVPGTEMAREIRKLVARFQNEEFQRVAPEKRRRAILSELDSLTSNEKLKGDLLKAFEAKGWMPLEGTLPKETTTLPQEEKVEKPGRPSAERTAPVKEGKVLEQIIADVSKTPSFGREQGKKIIAVSGENVAKDIRKLVQDFQEEEFKNLSKKAQTKTILDSINTLTSHPRLRADLREAFHEMGLLESVVRPSKVVLPPEERRRLAFRRSEEREGVPAAYHVEPEGIDPYMKRRKAKSTVPPTAPPAPQTVERQKTSEMRRAEALNIYFGKVKTGTDFVQKIIDMPRNADLQQSMSMEVSELEYFSGELFQKVIDVFRDFEAAKETKNALELSKIGETLLSSAKIPAGCHSALRAIIYADVLKKLESPAKTQETPPQPSGPAIGGAAEGAPFSYRPRSVDEVLDELVKGAPAPAHAAPQAAETAPATEAPQAAPASEGEAESFLERVRARGSRLWNPTPKSPPEAPPPAPPRTETITPPPAPPRTEATPPPAPPSAESAPTPPTIQPQVAETALPEKPKLDAEVPLMITREMEEQLAKRGLTTENINKLKPEEAWKILNSEEAPETAVAPATPPEALEAPPPTPSSIEAAEEQKELTFDDLSKLGRMSLWNLFHAADVRDKPALLAVLSAHSELRGVMLAGLSDVRRKEIEQDITALGSKAESEVREAERVIVEMARKQQQDGQLSIPPSAEAIVASGLTPDKIQSLTWENLFELDDDSLRMVVKTSDSSSYSWGSRMRKMPEPLISRVRACIGNQAEFDSGVNYESKHTAEDERKYRENNVWYAKRELLRILQQENPPQS